MLLIFTQDEYGKFWLHFEINSRWYSGSTYTFTTNFTYGEACNYDTVRLLFTAQTHPKILTTWLYQISCNWSNSSQFGVQFSGIPFISVQNNKGSFVFNHQETGTITSCTTNNWDMGYKWSWLSKYMESSPCNWSFGRKTYQNRSGFSQGIHPLQLQRFSLHSTARYSCAGLQICVYRHWGPWVSIWWRSLLKIVVRNKSSEWIAWNSRPKRTRRQADATCLFSRRRVCFKRKFNETLSREVFGNFLKNLQLQIIQGKNGSGEQLWYTFGTMENFWHINYGRLGNCEAHYTHLLHIT